MKTSSVKQLSIWGLILINLAALGGIRTWAPMAESGLAAIFFLFLAVTVFFIPLSLVTAELATAWPECGGVYVWVKKAFGHRTGFLAIWLLWVENVFWYPTILSFIVSSLAFVIDISLIHKPLYNLGLILAIFWLTTWFNLRGIKFSAFLSSMGAICGTFIAGLAIVALSVIWFFKGGDVQVKFSWDNLIPQMGSFSEWALFIGVLVSLLGVEMSAIHANHVKDPGRNYPKAIFYSSLVVFFFSVLGVLSIITVVPSKDLLLSAGCLQAFEFFLNAYGMKQFLPLVALFVAIGALGSMSTWIMGPCMGLHAAATPRDLPSFFTKLNRKGVPQNLLLFQAALVSFLSFLFVLMPTMNSAYWVLIVLTTQLYLIMYVLLFAAAIKLRLKFPDVRRPFSVPGGVKGMWILAMLGLLSSLIAWVICFFPPAHVSRENGIWYVLSLVGMTALFGALPFWVRKKER